MDKKLKKRIENVRRLFEGATTPGEKSAAKAMLDRLIAANNLKWSDVVVDEERVLTFFNCGQNSFHRKILWQCAGAVMNWDERCGSVFERTNNPNLRGWKVTKTEAKRIRELFKRYKTAWEADVALFYKAWIQKQPAILMPASPDQKPIEKGTDEWVEYIKWRKMMDGIDSLPDPTLKRIEA